MKYLEEENKNLINLRASLIPTIVVLSGGIVGLILSGANSFVKIIWIILGLYFDFLFIYNVTKINKIIENNIGVIKNGH